MGDSAQDKQRCAESLTGVTTCLPYLGGDTKAPTADCCSGLTQAMKTNKKCVCLILKDRDDPDLGLKINMTIAAALLHLDPKSPEAQAFNQIHQKSNGGSIRPSPTPSVEGSSQNGRKQGTDETATAKNRESYIGKRLLESLVAVAGLLIWLS
ncbi:non-specific lipid transfer protein GPI-anchored 14 [Glycine max]|uniref:non-specific lipid transfer protein GPI-anchored 14 n=1 Tax=Glycine max TaxID=3847 RepID=UPI0007194180|nr:non-specific lipid transfer protein GPI-anchored 14 [Glycine max]|eukprot:XP_014624270.1 protein YLS3 [Glycine max]